MKLFTHFFIIIFVFAFFIGNAFAEINMTVSPIKYELEIDPGDIITRTATLYNYSDKTLTINTSKAEFKADGSTGQPILVPYNEADNTVASWITLHTQDFTIAPNQQKTISFDVLIPDNARPGGHYAAVFFENNNAANGVGTNIGINVDYGVLLLITVSGDVVVDGDVDETEIVVRNGSSGGWGGGYSRKKDNCSLGDFSKSNFDNKCIDDLFVEDNIGDIEDDITFEQLDIAFEIPFDNKGNTHIKPTGKITLKDEDGRQINGIGKQVILNDNGAIIGEKIVDFIPINDIGGNVLPQTTRIFEGKWEGFPYKTYDNQGNEIVKYWSPDEYYSKKNIPENTILNFWERVLERSNKKKVTADIHISYTNLNGEEIEFNSAEDFYIEYVDVYVGVNKYVVLIGSLLGIFILFFLFARYKRKKKCHNCNKKIDKDLLICPYCGKRQKKVTKKVLKTKEGILKNIKLKKVEKDKKNPVVTKGKNKQKTAPKTTKKETVKKDVSGKKKSVKVANSKKNIKKK